MSLSTKHVTQNEYRNILKYPEDQIGNLNNDSWKGLPKKKIMITFVDDNQCH